MISEKWAGRTIIVMLICGFLTLTGLMCNSYIESQQRFLKR
jgi:hypothetical protein